MFGYVSFIPYIYLNVECFDKLYLRDIVRDVREVISWCDSQASLCLLRSCSDIVNNVSTPSLDIVGLKISHRRNVWVSRLAVVAFVVVVGQDLPVVRTVHLPAVIKDVVVKVEFTVLFLLIGTEEVVFPLDLGNGFGIEVDPNETIAVNVYMNGKQAILGLVKACELLISWCLGQVPTQTVRPAMVSKVMYRKYQVYRCIALKCSEWLHYLLAREDHGRAFLLMNNGIGAVAADVVKSIDLTLAVARYYEVKVCNLKVEPVSSIGNSVLVCDKLPPAGKDGALLELIQLG